jgi:hypothetical protein
MKQVKTIADAYVTGVTGFPKHDTVDIFVRVPRAQVSLYELTEYLRPWLEARGGQVISTHSRPDWDGVARPAWTDEVEGYE